MRWLYAVFAALVVFAGALTWVVLRGEDTRHEVRVIQRGPAVACVRGDDEACRRLLRALIAARRKADGSHRVHGDTGSKGGTTPRGGGAGTSPTGGGPVGRVPSPASPPKPSNPPTGGDPTGGSQPPVDQPTLDLDVPLVPKVCVGDLVAVNC